MTCESRVFIEAAGPLTITLKKTPICVVVNKDMTICVFSWGGLLDTAGVMCLGGKREKGCIFYIHSCHAVLFFFFFRELPDKES